MTVQAPANTETPAARKRGPNTPEGKARSAMNALRHGLRARSFALLPEEDPAEWAEHLADLRRDLGPVDATEEKLVAALAVAMWKEIRADRIEALLVIAALQERMKGFLANPNSEQMEAVLAEMRAYADAAKSGHIEIPQRWTSYN